MAEKISTLIIEVDLHCTICTKKIKKVLTKLQDREKIQSVAYEEKTDTVIVSGPFDPKRLSKKLCCKAGNVIKNIHVKPDEPPPEEPPPPPPPSPPPKQLAFPYPYFCCAYAYPYLYPYPYLAARPFVSACECHGRCRCKVAADALPPPVEAVPVPVPVPFRACGAGCYDGCRTCKFVCEDEAPTCSII